MGTGVGGVGLGVGVGVGAGVGGRWRQRRRLELDSLLHDDLVHVHEQLLEHVQHATARSGLLDEAYQLRLLGFDTLLHVRNDCSLRSRRRYFELTFTGASTRRRRVPLGSEPVPAMSEGRRPAVNGCDRDAIHVPGH